MSFDWGYEILTRVSFKLPRKKANYYQSMRWHASFHVCVCVQLSFSKTELISCQKWFQRFVCSKVTCVSDFWAFCRNSAWIPAAAGPFCTHLQASKILHFLDPPRLFLLLLQQRTFCVKKKKERGMFSSSTHFCLTTMVSFRFPRGNFAAIAQSV